jgi:glycosyltransferase involved in cell wall biosynthesis
MSKLISVIIPNYNESENVKRGVIQGVLTYLQKQPYDSEIIISDDGSTDASVDLIKAIAKKHPEIRVIKNLHAGKPFALRAGISAAKGQYVLLTDMDQSTPISELGKLVSHLQEGYQVVIGSRGARRTDSTPFRQLASIIFLSVRRLILLPEIKDTQCGFKLVQTKLAQKIFAHMRILSRQNNAHGWKVTAYDVELLFLAKKMGEKIKEVRVIWKNEDTSLGKSRNFVKESIEMFIEILRVRVNDSLGKYDR